MAHDVATLIYKLALANEKVKRVVRLQIIHGVIGDYEVSKCIKIKSNKEQAYIQYNGITVPFTHYQVLIQQLLIEFLEVLNKQNQCDSFAQDTSYIVSNVLVDAKIVATCKFVFKETITQEDILDYEWTQKCQDLSLYIERYLTFARDIVM